MFLKCLKEWQKCSDNATADLSFNDGNVMVEGATHVDMFDNIRKCAFTLAEVLITLGIIGVVAAITLPPLIQHHNKVVWVNQLKKAVNTLENGFKMAMSDEEVYNLSDTGLWQSINDCGLAGFVVPGNNEVFLNFLKKYFNFYPMIFPSCLKYDVKPLYGSSYAAPIPFIQSNDGMQFTFHFCHKETEFIGQLFSTSYSRGLAEIIIDVNGNKKPNQVGRDIFTFLLTDKGRLLPFPSKSTQSEYCSYLYNDTEDGRLYCNNFLATPVPCEPDRSDGVGCAARIIENGWKMDY